LAKEPREITGDRDLLDEHEHRDSVSFAHAPQETESGEGLDWRAVYLDGIPRHPAWLAAKYQAAGYWGNDTITSRLDRIMAERPGATALVDGVCRISYAQLGSYIGACASALSSLGIGPGDAVVVQLPNWWEQLVAVFAIVQVGAMVVPVNVRLRGELEYILEYTRSKLLIAPDEYHGFSHGDLIDSLRGKLPDLRDTVTVRGTADRRHATFEELLAKGSSHPVVTGRTVLSADDPWEVMFTSGTTSAPKGVVLTHNNTLYTLRLLVEEYHILQGDGTDVALAVLPIAFVYAQYLCALAALLTGGTLVLQESFDATELMDLVERERVTLIALVPSMVPTFQHGADLRARDLSSLRIVAPAGEAVTRERKSELFEIFGCDVRECYGLAEVTMPLVQPADATQEQKLSSTGRRNPATELRIVDDEGNDLGVGEIGELLVRGPTLFPGYYQNPEATTKSIEEAGWFHTGDLVARDTNGFYAISGRKKDLIKRGGASILPQEIEDALEGHPAVAAVTAFALPDERRGEIACACVVLKAGTSASAEELLGYLRARIATFKVPERIEFVESLPLSANGKVLKQELAARFAARSA